MTEYLICVLIMTLFEVNENHLKSIRDMDGVPNYDFGIFQTWVGILIRLIIWIIPGSILLYFLFGAIFNGFVQGIFIEPF